ncbi:MAG: PP2C family protein-serine/threonine phosphatase, partial [Spirochaetia bacterium]|nr:PP2C family protein-serine/threonine phosphatase [Spirochaetia bacterium]
TGLILIEYLIIRFTPPSRLNKIHGYVFTLAIGTMISQMTVDLGGFNSNYYAGLLLVIIAVNMLLVWSPFHSLLNGAITIGIYVALNLATPHPFEVKILVNNLFFLCSTLLITVTISWVRYKLAKTEYELRSELVQTNLALDRSRAEVLHSRDALWGELQIAKVIQTALLPVRTQIGRYEVSAISKPAEEVGGDYYDLIETKNGECWAGIGDVSGHGVDSGLFMMMAQTSLQTAVNARAGQLPSEVLGCLNQVLRENSRRLGSDRYMTMALYRLEPDRVVFSGKHLTCIVYRAKSKQVELIETSGSWLSLSDDLQEHLDDRVIPMGTGDLILLYSDGITEAQNEKGKFFGEDGLVETLCRNAQLPLPRIGQALFSAFTGFSREQRDDITLVLLKNGIHPGERS